MSDDIIWLTEVISKALQKSEFADYPLDLHSFCLKPYKNIEGVEVEGAVVLEYDFDEKEKNLFWRILNSASPDRKGFPATYFHFKSFELGIRTLETGHIQASNLFSNRYNDFAEAEEFVRRYGNVVSLIPRGYSYPGLVKPENRLIDTIKENTCVLCLTSSFKDPRFWKSYVNDGNGICFEFFYEPESIGTLMVNNALPILTRNGALNLYDLREICYDNGSMFDFINEISYYIFQRTRCVLNIPGTAEFARSYKRSKYSWERKTRLILKLDLIEQINDSRFHVNTARDHDGKERKYVDVPIKNYNIGTSNHCLFSLSISRVICGYNIRPQSDEWNRIEELADKYYGIPVKSVLDEL